MDLTKFADKEVKKTGLIKSPEPTKRTYASKKKKKQTEGVKRINILLDQDEFSNLMEIRDSLTGSIGKDVSFVKVVRTVIRGAKYRNYFDDIALEVLEEFKVGKPEASKIV